MNWFLGSSWIWKALRGQSVTFAALFASAMLGISVIKVLRHFLSLLGVPWLLLFFVPFFLVGFFARHEKDWLPLEETRRRWSQGLVFGSILIFVCVAHFSRTSQMENPPHSPAREHGIPSNK